MTDERAPNEQILADPQLQADLETLFSAMTQEIGAHPPTIGLVGTSGVGKSSTINRLFKTSLPTSGTVASTKAFQAVDLTVSITQRALEVQNQVLDQEVKLRIFDAPGLGEDISTEAHYLKMYHEHLPSCDVILWIITARNRALALDQRYLQEFAEMHDRIVFGMNQVDLVEPLNWNERINLPSDEQLQNIDSIVQDRQKRFEDVLQKEVTLIPYSSRKGYQLESLFSEMLQGCPPEREWMFISIKNFKVEDFIPAEVLDYVKQQEQKPIKKEPALSKSSTGFMKLWRTPKRRR